MKKFVLGFLCGALIFTTIGVLAVEYNIYPNPFKILVDGAEKQIESYNIDGYSYFKLRDLLSAVGDYGVDFVDDSIIISTNGAGADDNTVTPPIPIGENKYEIPVVTADSPEYSTTVDGIEMRIVAGQYCVYKDNIIKKLNDMGYINYVFGTDVIFDTSNRYERVLENIPTINENQQYIPLSFYYSTILPWIESLV